jgi:hypothetical protein
MPKKERRRVIAPRLDDFVAKLLGNMMSYGEVVDYAMDKFGCDERTVTRAIARVRAGWQQASAASVDERRAKFLGELEHAMRGAIAAADYRALAVMFKTRSDVEGIRSVKKVELGGTVGLRPVAAMSPQERERELQILIAKRQAALGPGKTPAIVDAVAVERAAAPELDAGDVAEVVRPRAPSKPGRRKRKAQVH